MKENDLSVLLGPILYYCYPEARAYC